MATHEMPISLPSFNNILSGNKNIEVRLCYQNRKNIKTDDLIIFNCDNKKIKAKVLKTLISKDLNSLSKIIKITDTGWSNKEKWFDVMHGFYTDEDIAKYGLIAIYFKLI